MVRSEYKRELLRCIACSYVPLTNGVGGVDVVKLIVVPDTPWDAAGVLERGSALERSVLSFHVSWIEV